ncbi:MAG: DUF1552 domain-containing protein [Myxococcota bacterium]
MKPTSRRLFLRGASAGASIALALPTLDCMLNDNGTAYADDTPIPQRFIAWHWGNGVQGPLWVPSTSPHWTPGQNPFGFRADHFRGSQREWIYSRSSLGRGYASSPELAPLFEAGMNGRVSVVSGTGVGRDGAHYAHAHGWDGLVHEQLVQRDNWIWPANPGAPTFIDHIASRVRGDAPFGLTRLQVNRTMKYHDHTPSTALGVNDPRVLFNTLFAGVSGDEASPDVAPNGHADVLSAVQEDARRLQERLGSSDRERIEEYLQSIRDIQGRLELGMESHGACVVPTMPPANAPWSPTQARSENLEARDELFVDIVVAALTCDLTRAVQYIFSHGQHNAVFENHSEVPVSRDLPEGFPEYVRFSPGGGASLPKTERGHHENAHTDNPSNALFHHRSTVFTMGRFAKLVKRLSEVSVGDHDLLHHTGIFGWTEQDNYYAANPNAFESNNHRHDHIPILVAGEAGGRLVSGEHIQPDTIRYSGRQEQSSRVVLSLFRAFGVDKPTWGDRVRRRDTPIEELLA